MENRKTLGKAPFKNTSTKIAKLTTVRIKYRRKKASTPTKKYPKRNRNRVINSAVKNHHRNKTKMKLMKICSRKISSKAKQKRKKSKEKTLPATLPILQLLQFPLNSQKREKKLKTKLAVNISQPLPA